MICPTCAGVRRAGGLGCGPDGCRPMVIECGDCRGTGEIPDERAAWIAAGNRLRSARIARGVSLREQAQALGMAPSALSDLEHGRADPSGLLIYCDCGEPNPCPIHDADGHHAMKFSHGAVNECICAKCAEPPPAPR